MSDYKSIHEEIRQRDYDYRAGWESELIGRGIALGVLFAVAVVMIGRMV
jgi:tetrahydromethanopterin S-methyltransferase subunit F